MRLAELAIVSNPYDGVTADLTASPFGLVFFSLIPTHQILFDSLHSFCSRASLKMRLPPTFFARSAQLQRQTPAQTAGQLRTPPQTSSRAWTVPLGSSAPETAVTLRPATTALPVSTWCRVLVRFAQPADTVWTTTTQTSAHLAQLELIAQVQPTEPTTINFPTAWPAQPVGTAPTPARTLVPSARLGPFPILGPATRVPTSARCVHRGSTARQLRTAEQSAPPAARGSSFPTPPPPLPISSTTMQSPTAPPAQPAHPRPQLGTLPAPFATWDNSRMWR